MSLPQQLLDAYHASLGSDFNGLPKMPRNIAEPRLIHLQAELDELTESHPDYENFSAKLQSEIAETQAIVDNQEYTEDETEIAYWETYRAGLRQFLINRQQEGA